MTSGLKMQFGLNRMAETSASPSRVHRHSKRGYVASLLLHGCILGAVSMWALPAWDTPVPSAVETAAGAGTAQAEDRSDTQLEMGEGDLGKLTLESELDRRIEQLSDLGRSRQLDELDDATRKLERISSVDSVNQVADHAETLLGLNRRASVPAQHQDANAEFDASTAQFHDVRREVCHERESADGYRYIAVLIDASGNTQEMEMSAADGEGVWQVMQKIKASPLLESIYRRLAMPMLDKLMEDQPKTADPESTSH